MKRYERAKQIMQIRLSTKEAYHPGFFIRDKRLSLKLKLDDFTSSVPLQLYLKLKQENSHLIQHS